MPNSQPRRPLLAAAGIFLLAAIAAGALIWHSEQHNRREESAHAVSLAGEYAQNLQRSIEHSLSATYALGALVRQGKGAVLDFQDVASQLLPMYPGVTELALVPGGVIRQVAPLAGNEKALGLDLLQDPVQKREALLARNSGKLTLAGPLELVQGGVGVVGRLPVFFDENTEQPRFWGFTLVVIRLPEALEVVNLSSLTGQGFAYELWREHPDTRQKQLIAVSPGAAPVDPVVRTLRVPNGAWNLSISPLTGWGDPVALALKSALGLSVSLLLAYVAMLLLILRKHKQGLEALISKRTAALREGEVRYRELFDANPQPMWVYDMGTLMFLAVNDAAVAHYGYSREEFLAMRITDIRTPEEAARLMHRVEVVRRDDVRDAGLWQHRRKDGSLIDVEVTAHTIDFGGRRAQIVHVSDVTERLRAERALREGEARFRAIAELSSDWYWEQDDKLRFVRPLTPMEGEQDVDPRVFYGKTRRETSGVVFDEPQLSELEAICEARQPFRDFEMGRRSFGGPKRYTQLSGEPIFDATGRFTGYRGIGKDITERRRDERLLRLEHNVAARTAGAGDASAVMKEILSAICESEGWGFGLHWYVDAAAGVLRFGEFWSLPDPGLERYAEATRQVVFAPGVGMVGHVFQSGGPLWVPDTTADARVVQGVLLETGLRSLFAFPLVASGKVTGVLAFLSREAREPDARLLAAAQVLGSQVGQFLQRRQREEELQRFSAAMDASAEGIYVVDRASMRFIHVNASAGAMLGMTREEIFALGPEGVLGGSREVLARIYDEVIAGRLTEPVELPRQREDGRTVWVEIQRRAQETDAGWAIVTVARDITERKLNENALRESEARFRSLTAMSSDFYWETDAEHRITQRSEGGEASSLSVLAHASPMGLRRWDLPYLSPDESGWQAHRQTLDAHLPVRDFEFSRLGTDGTELHYSISADPMFDASGAFKGYRGVGSNITSRKRAQAQMRLAASVFDHAQEGIIITDADANTVSVNKRFTEITGYSADEALGRNPRMLKSGRQGADFYRAMWAFINTHGYWTGELWNRHKDGHEYPEWLSISAVRDERGQVVNYVAVCVDISQRMAAEQALRASEEKFGKAFRATPMFVSISTVTDGRYIDVNDAFLRATGRTRDEVIAHTAGEIGLWKNLEDRQRAIDALQASGRISNFEAELCKKSGDSMTCEIWAEPIAIGDAPCVIWVTNDVSVRKRAETEIRQLNAELEKRVAERTRALEVANTELEAFSYSVSHDLRAPLRAIQGFSRLVETQYASQIDEQGQGMLRRVGAGAQKMGLLIDDLLRLSDISRQTMRIGAVDLSALARELADELQAGEPERRAEWIIAPGVTAEGDAGLLRAALQNLIGNAWKYSSRRDEARIEFGIAQSDGRAVYFVRDNGAGFDMSYAKKLFGAFQRLHSTTEFPGTGIGLATVARILHRHGGKVWAEGRVGEGATFYFSLG